MGLGIALGAFLKCLFNKEFGQEVKDLAISRKELVKEALKKTDKETPLVEETPIQENSLENKDGEIAIVNFLAELQKDGRFIDFIEEDLSQYDDEEIGGSVRSIHEGCKKVLNQVLEKEKIIEQEEESSYRVNQGYDTHSIKLNGKVSDNFPLKGTLVHPGWKVKNIELINRNKNLAKIINPAEVEIE